MSGRMVIEDSDDDGDSIGIGGGQSPVMSGGNVQNPGASQVRSASVAQSSAVNGTGSTDSPQFRAIYNAERAALGLPDDSPQAQRRPVAGETPLKRNMTTSSLSAAAESESSDRAAKRVRTAESSTQAKSPQGGDGHIDIWDVPSSSAEDNAVGGKNAAKRGGLKTYGRLSAGKTKPKSASVSSQNQEVDAKTPLRQLAEDTNQKRSKPESSGQESHHPMSPPAKRHKQQTPDAATAKLVGNMLAAVKQAGDARVSSSGIQVPRSASQDARIGEPIQLSGKGSSESSLGFVPETSSSTGLKSLPAGSGNVKASASTVSVEKSSPSLMVIPNTLSNSQRAQYDNVSVTSTAPPEITWEMPSTFDQNRKFTGELSTIPNDTPRPKISPAPQDTPGMTHPPPSSPPVSAASKGKVSFKSSAGARSSIEPKASRNDTTAVSSQPKSSINNEIPRGRRPSMDELALPSTGPLPSPVPAKKGRGRPKGSKKTKARDDSDLEDDALKVDELLGSDDIGLPKEQYKPRPSARRAKSSGKTQEANLESDLGGSEGLTESQLFATIGVGKKRGPKKKAASQEMAQQSAQKHKPVVIDSDDDDDDEMEEHEAPVRAHETPKADILAETPKSFFNPPTKQAADPTPIPKQRGRPRKQTIVSDDEDEEMQEQAAPEPAGAHDEAPMVDAPAETPKSFFDPPSKQVTDYKSPSKPRGRPRKNLVVSDTDDEEMEEHEALDEVSAIGPPAETPKSFFGPPAKLATDSKSPPKPRGRPRKNPVVEKTDTIVSDGDDDDDIHEHGGPEKSAANDRTYKADTPAETPKPNDTPAKQATDSTPMPKQRGRPRKNPVEPVEEPADQPAEPTSAPKKRGRPRKKPVEEEETSPAGGSKVPKAASTSLLSENTAAVKYGSADQDDASPVFKKKPNNLSSARPAQSPTRESTPLLKEKQTETETPAPGEASVKTPSNGKQAKEVEKPGSARLRVGLSKKTRIAPLLKMIRK